MLESGFCCGGAAATAVTMADMAMRFIPQDTRCAAKCQQGTKRILVCSFLIHEVLMREIWTAIVEVFVRFQLQFLIVP